MTPFCRVHINETLVGLKILCYGPVNTLSSEQGVHPAMVSQWKKAAVEILEQGFADKRKAPKEKDGFEKEQLLAQIGQLKVELDWLKKRV